jgi:hypothetical protein
MDFILGLPPTFEAGHFTIRIGAPLENASYIVETSTGQISSGTVTPDTGGGVAIVSPNISLQVTSNENIERMKGIRIRATGANPITVLVSVITTSGYGAYLMHRNDEFQDVERYEYYAVSTNSSRSTQQNLAGVTHSSTLLIGNFDETIVTITPTQTITLPAQDAEGGDDTLVNVTAGSSHTVTLHTLQTLLLSSPNDMTGTRIVSDKPLTVLTGHDCGQLPEGCEPMYVHALPTVNWGQEFLLAPFNGNIQPQYYTFVTSQDTTTVAYRCDDRISESVTISKTGEGTLLAFPPNSFCSLVASRPIFVVHQRASRRLGDFMGDPYVTIISPTTKYINEITFTNIEINPRTLPENFIIVTVRAEHYDPTQILLDGNPLSCTWTAIPSITSDESIGYGCTVGIESSVHVVSHSKENGLLSVVVYGYYVEFGGGNTWGYAFLAGINLDSDVETEGMCVHNYKVTI